MQRSAQLGLGSLATLDTVTGGQIGADSVTNDDISANAEIAQSKIANLSTDFKLGSLTGDEGRRS
jgi:hypothetical protein